MIGLPMGGGKENTTQKVKRGQGPKKELYMGQKEFMVDLSYPGYVFVGWAAGRFETDRKEKRP